MESINMEKFGILTVSDSCFNGIKEDKSGPNLKNVLITNKGMSLDICESQIVMKCVADEKDAIQEVLLDWVEEQKLRLILTTGGTGFSPRDVTPEATKSVLDKETPGLVIAMISKSLQVTEMAMLSRLACGIRKNTLIINLPGSKKGSEECLGFVLPALTHALDLIQDRSEHITITHKAVQSTTPYTCPHGHIKNPKGTRTHEDFFPVAQRPRHSPYPLLPVNEAIKKILEETPWPPATIEKDLADVLHCVLAWDVKTMNNLPPFPASIKDGYAVISSDGPGQRQVLKPITAGEESSVIVTPGTVARITTGAPVPQGSDAIVMVENTKLISTSEEGNEEKIVEILVSSKIGQDIRPVGFDVKKGDIILEKGIVIGAAEMGIAAGAGINRLSVYEQPRVVVLSTGNEVINPGIDLKPGQIYDSNRYSILSLLKERNCLGVDLGIAKDTRNELVEQIRNGLEQADVLITTGGVSMGEKDLLKPVLVQDFNAVIHFGRVFMKPGKPTTFASVLKNGKKKLIFALPGNPVSAMVTFELFVLPALKKLAGLTTTTSSTFINTKVTFPIQLDPRPEYHRVKIVWKENELLPIAMTTGSQMSSRLLSMKGANGLLVLPPREDDRTVINIGETVQALLIHRGLF